MADMAIPVFKTAQELEQAIQRYRASDWSGTSLFTLWEAIRTASIEQASPGADDRVPGEDSY